MVLSASAGWAGGTFGANEPDPDDVCPTPSCSNNSTAGEDDRYLNASKNLKGAAQLTNGTKVPDYSATATVDPGIQGDMPNTAMPPKDTPQLSLVQYFPWMFKDIDNAITDPYYGFTTFVQQGTYRGAGNNTYTNMDNPTNLANTGDQPYMDTASTNSVNSSINALNVNTGDMDKQKCKPFSIKDACPSVDSSPDYAHIERLNRLQYDNCANQYILGGVITLATGGTGSTPIIMTQVNRDHGSPWNESRCQPLHLVTPPCIQNLMNGGGCKKDYASDDGVLYDYRAAAYLWEAWITLLDGGSIGGGGQPYYAPTGGVSGGDSGTRPIKTSTSAGTDFPFKGPAVSGEEKIINFGSDPLGLGVNSNPVTAGSYGYKSTPNCGTDTGGSCSGGGGASFTGAKTTLKDLSTYPYERIWDPTHPFTPRWDWNHTDRDYSSGAIGPNPQLSGAINVGYDLPGGSCIVRCAAVPVDILSFRAPEFSQCMSKRIQLNTQCFWTEVAYLQTPCPWPFHTLSEPEAYADTIADIDTSGCHPLNVPAACKSYYAMNGQWPPCSTKYDHPADATIGDYCSSARTLIGDPSPPSGGVNQCCNDLARALTPINTLKIRNTSMTTSLSPVPEGYKFSDYFGNHMPYMRWWDTGAAAGGGMGTPNQNYDPNCNLGQYDVIVGAGVEGTSCKFGGNGAATTYPDGGGCISLHNPDSLTSWSELKQYQTTKLFRVNGMNCIAQYEKMFKPFSGEDGAMAAVGGYATVPFPVMADDGTTVQGYQTKNLPWPLTRRGYLSASNTANRFPDWGGPAPSAAKMLGLDNAQVGDVIYLTFDDVLTPKGSGTIGISDPDDNIMPFVAVVTGIGSDSCDKFVQVVDMNNGKFPDVCGNTDYAGFGMGQARTIYKNNIPTNILGMLNPAGTTTSCGTVPSTVTGLNVNSEGNCKDPKYSVCTYNTPSLDVWDNIHIYRPCLDYRGITGACPKPVPTS